MRFLFLTACFILAASSAIADDAPRKINFQTIITVDDGLPVQDCIKPDTAAPGGCAQKVDMTLGRLAMHALTIQYPQEAQTGEEQVHRALLAQQIYKGDGVALDSKDTDTLCTAIAKFVNKSGLSASATLQAWSIIDPLRVKK